MKYMGSKARVAKHILPIVLKNRTEGQWYVEPFLGGANMIDKVHGNRLGGEINNYIAKMWEAMISGWTPPELDRDTYNHIRDNKGEYELRLVGWAGIACSYSGKWFGGFAGKVRTKGGVRDYQDEARRNAAKQLKHLDGLKVAGCGYSDLDIPDGSIIYCDPPYEGATKYKDSFSHAAFWQWCRDMVSQGHNVFVSEYNAPDDFVRVWHQEVKSSLSANGKVGGNKVSVECLFRHGSQIAL